MSDGGGDWWKLEVPAHVDLTRPGIYEWRIANESVYIGKSCRLRRRIRE
ncbi:hypothetical protein N0B51_03420 [Tsuneonella sp. YG55]|uniref:GIY-YIG domain-containing protein n=1 Tax=Tsuneonella litorea TaxID=2976475 RepID=A0A9X2W0P0_9SPHN|nr:hypothetical protein [Tsuneonella litorea]MCT2558024.1 hypothetical protein [Tsuneonella litorea]